MPFAFVTYEVAPADLDDAMRAVGSAGYIVEAQGESTRTPGKLVFRVTSAPYDVEPGGIDNANPVLCNATAEILMRLGIDHEMSGNGVGDVGRVWRL